MIIPKLKMLGWMKTHCNLRTQCWQYFWHKFDNKISTGLDILRQKNNFRNLQFYSQK